MMIILSLCDMVHTVDMIYTIDMAYPVHMVYTDHMGSCTYYVITDRGRGVSPNDYSIT